MKAKTKRKLSTAIIIALAVLFALGQYLIFAPRSQPSQATPPPALNNIPNAQNQVPDNSNLPPEVQAKLREQQSQQPGPPAPVQ